MAGADNLIPFNKLPEDLKREIQAKGRRASLEKRRQKKVEEHYFKILMGLPISGEKNIAKLKEMGIDPKHFKNEMLSAISLMKLIVDKNDLDAIKYGDEILGKNPALELKKKQSKVYDTQNPVDDDKLLEALDNKPVDWSADI